MTAAFWKQLKSGTDIRGVALSDETGEPITLTDEVTERLAGGFVRFLSDKLCKAPAALTISVGRDSRLSGMRLRDAVIRALCAQGVTVSDCGLSSTPAMFMTTVELACDGAIQLTASHHPYQRNGLKFFTRQGGLDSADIDTVLAFAEENAFAKSGGGQVLPVDFMTQYAAHLRGLIVQGVGAPAGTLPLAGFHIVVDAGNGVGGFYATDVLAPLGADISGSQFLEPDGHFPHHIPNPENAEAMASVCAAVVAAGADLGVIFDTDVDRAGCVGANGQEIGRNRLVALAAALVLAEHPGATIVTDSITSSGLKTFIEQELGGVHRRFKRGYKNVINEAIRLDAPLAIETSGHAAFAENAYLDDGAYLVTKIMIAAARLRRDGRTVDDLLSALAQPAESVELRFAVTPPDFRAYGEKVLAALTPYAAAQGWTLAQDSCEGVRVCFPDGWLLLRLSVHDPVMPLNIESNHIGGCRQLAAAFAAFVAPFDGLDQTALTAYL